MGDILCVNEATQPRFLVPGRLGYFQLFLQPQALHLVLGSLFPLAGLPGFLFLCPDLGYTLLHLPQVLGEGVNSHPAPGCCLIDEVNGLVRKATFGEITVGETDRSFQGFVGETDLVELLVTLPNAPEDLYRLLHGGLLHPYGGKTPLQRAVLLDVLPVLVRSRGPYAPELPAGQSGLQKVGRVDGP